MFDEMSGRSSPVGSMMGSANMDMSIGPSMFDTIGRPPSFGPTPDQMAEAMKRVQLNRKVTLQNVTVKTYDLGDPVECDQYQKDLKEILLGIPAKTHVLLSRPAPMFVNDNMKPRYIAHMQWVEFKLEERAVPSTAALQKEKEHGKATISETD